MVEVRPIFFRNDIVRHLKMSPLSLLILLFSGLWGVEVRAKDGESESKQKIENPWDVDALMRSPDVEWLDQQGPVRRLYYQGEALRGKPTRVFAYFASPSTLLGKGPKDGKKYPGIVLAHGGGGKAFSEWASQWAQRGYAALAMDLSGRNEKGERMADGGPDQLDDSKFGNIAGPAGDQWVYHGVANVIRAHSLLRSLDEVDAERTAITGISWGGFLTCIVAGIDPRFKAAVPVYGCGFIHEQSKWLKQFSAMPAADRQRWVKLWEPSNYIGQTTVPMFFVNGTNDGAYPLESYMKTYHLVKGAKNIRITVNMSHGHPPGWAPPEIGLFVDQYLRKGDALAEVSKPVVRRNAVRATVRNQVPLQSAMLHYTADTRPTNKGGWKSQPLQIGRSSVQGPGPPAAAQACFITVTDRRGATVSSEVVWAGP